MLDHLHTLEALTESETRLRRVQVLACLGYWEWDILNDNIIWSDEIYSLYGLDRNTPLTYARLMQVIHPDDRDYHDKKTADCRINHGGEPFEYRVLWPDGSIRYVRTTGEVICNAAGEVVRFFGIVQDVTDAKRREQALQESEERFRATFDQAAVGIAHVSTDGHFLRINQKFCDITGYPQAEMLTLSFQEITYPDDLDVDLIKMQQLLAGEIETYSMEKRYIRKNGELVWINLTGSLIRNEDRSPAWFVAVVEDISQRKQAEQSVYEYQQRLKYLAHELARTEERERRTIATELHDHIGQSLAIMRIQLGSARREAVGRKVDAILSEVSDSLREAIKDTRSIMSDLSSATLNELGLCAAIADWLKEQIGERHGLETVFSDDGQDKPLSDYTKAILFRCVRELLVNVVKHAKAAHVSVSVSRVSNAVRIVIEDDGVGLTPAKLNNASIDEGGFGLFSIEERMSDLGGSFMFESPTDQGVRSILIAPLEFK